MTKARLTPDDCELIAKVRLNTDYPLEESSVMPEYACAIEWLEAGYE